ncbi:MAG TPA: right-handed parallel beta-helix repeat-containing protein, partial [Bacteroidia bacterium]|nr:right-handed parallel beta-helix repeat-containing protein [Bacteroidia bacterium]
MKTKLLSLFTTLIFVTSSTFGTTFTVNNNSDSGAGSLRQAILDANAAGGIDTINFNIGSGAQTITLLSTVSITGHILVDGTTQPGFVSSPLISIAGSSMFQLNGANGATIKYLDFSGISGSTAISANSVNNCVFDHDNLSGVSTGVSFAGTDNNDTISNCNMSGASNFGIYMNANAQNFVITNNNLTNCASWGLYYNYGTPAAVSGNNFTGSANAWYLNNCTSHFTITPPTGTGPNKNTYGGHTGNVLYLQNCNTINVSGWDFTTITASPLNSRTPLLVSGCNNCLFNNDNLSGMSTGVSFAGTDNNDTISNCNMSGASNFGIYMNANAQNFVITNNNL